MAADSQRVKELFVAALELPDPPARREFLDQECHGDDCLRQRLEALLAAHDAPHLAVNKPLGDDFTGAFQPGGAAPSEAVGSVIAGKYKLLQEIGEGGMGSVFMADQTNPVKRRVAVKVIKVGMDSARVLARFEAERQALALMDHPNIAKVLDAGATETGKPFFVMELVRGVPLTQYCDDLKLPVLDRLSLFQQICSAVQHAHQKGVIHRDLKPTNILVESHDGKPVPKVIDFGLAKATTGVPLTEHTLFTALGTVAGTPLYMAPEQATFNAIDVDTRADVYALGVILYELLTGTTPIERVTFKAAAFDEMLRVIREQDPPTPSSRLSSSDSKPSVAALRGMEPAKLGRIVRGELDWIVMKSLSKERDRRYETASGFAMDIERFLNHEPVLAGPPSAGYRLRKFVRRNRLQVIAAALVLGALVAGMTGMAIGLIRAEHARADEATQRQVADAERLKAENAEAATMADYRASTDDAIEQLIGSKSELGEKEKTYLENTLKRWQAYAARQGDDERSRVIRGEGHFHVALMWYKLDRNEEARDEYQTARVIFMGLADQFPALPEHQQRLARTHNNLGIVLRELGEHDQARKEHEAARVMRKKLVEQFPEDLQYQKGLAGTHSNLGIVLADLGRQEDARIEFEAARDFEKTLVKQLPTVPGIRQGLSSTHHNLGNLLRGLGKREEALAEYEAARDIRKKLVADFPDRPAYKLDLANIHNSFGNLLVDFGKHEEGREEHQAARDILKKLVAQFPAVPGYQLRLAGIHGNLASVLGKLGKREDALVEHRAAGVLQEKLVRQFPKHPAYLHAVARTHNNLGGLLRHLDQREEARAEYLASRDILKKLVSQCPDVSKFQVDLGMSYCNYGVVTIEVGKPAESLKWFDLAIQILMPIHKKESRDVEARSFLISSYWGLAQAHDQLHQPAEAVKHWNKTIELTPPAERMGFRASRATSQVQAGNTAEAIAEAAELTKSPAWDVGQWYDFACVYALASGKVADQKKVFSDRAMELLHKAVKAGYKNSAHMAKDSDLDSLRDREDFKMLLAELAKVAAPGK